MYQISVKDGDNYQVNIDKNGIQLNGENIDWSLIKPEEGLFNILLEGKSYNARVVSADFTSKSFVIRVNGTNYFIEAKDQYDVLLEKLGMANLGEQKVNDIKAPMPGLVLQVVTEVGKSVEKGDSLLILEAMKMENVLKSPGAGIVKSIKVAKGETVEKGQILVEFE